MPPPTLPRRRFRWRWFFGAVGALLAVSVVTIVLSFRMGGEARAIRRAVFDASPGTWERQVEFGVGRLPVMLAKAGLSFLPLEPEARAGLRAFRCADIGVYRRQPGCAAPAGAEKALAHVDRLMTGRGWERVVAVRDGEETVGIFMPSGARSADDTRVCLLVIDGSELVIVSAQVDLEPLVDLALASHPALLASR